MRFLMVAAGYPPLRSAGLETGCQRLAQALGRRGHETIVLTQHAPGMPAVVSESDGVEVHRVVRPLSLGPLWGLTYMSQVRLWMRRLAARWDFVLCHKLGLHSVVVPATANRLGKQSATLLVNAGLYSDIKVLREHRGGGYLLKQALTSDGFFALSQVSRQELGDCGVASDRIQPFRYMVDVERFSPGEANQRHFLFVGRFHRQKNLPLLVEAFAKVQAVEPEARLVMIGRGDEEALIRRSVEQSSAFSAICIENWTDNPAAAYRQALAVVSSSDAEGLSNVSVEAAACGAPTILTDVSGVREVLLPGDDTPVMAGNYLTGRGGLVVPPRDADALSRAMLAIYRDNALRSKLAEEARNNAVSRFSEQVCVDLFLSGVEAITKGAGGRS